MIGLDVYYLWIMILSPHFMKIKIEPFKELEILKKLPNIHVIFKFC